ncbi:MAG: hypothetical protein NVSMB45_01280 [Ginsengibacter sp.]
MASFFLLGASVNAQTKQEKKEEKKEAVTKANAAKADVLIQKNNIYDKDVLQNENKPQMTEKVRPIKMRTRFHKRKLHHRLRRRKF